MIKNNAFLENNGNSFLVVSEKLRTFARDLRTRISKSTQNEERTEKGVGTRIGCLENWTSR
jgi:hypothetical protein